MGYHQLGSQNKVAIVTKYFALEALLSNINAKCPNLILTRDGKITWTRTNPDNPGRKVKKSGSGMDFNNPDESGSGFKFWVTRVSGTRIHFSYIIFNYIY